MIGLNYLGKLGQLGNQMFQYATAMGVANKLNTSVTIPNHKDALVDHLGNTLRIELFDAFKINPYIGYVNGIDIQEPHFEFNPNLFEMDREREYCLIGFFQSEKYFKHIEDEVRNEFKFLDHIVEDCKGAVEIFDNPVALHIRRGDFLINSGNHHNVSMEYYQEALKEFPDRQVVIFSDDPLWCHDEPTFADDRFLVSDADSPYHDLYLMSQCSDFIIACSTFSWWGAWLANKGTVIAPNKWFGPNNADKDTRDLYPEHWKVIPFS